MNICLSVLKMYIDDHMVETTCNSCVGSPFEYNSCIRCSYKPIKHEKLLSYNLSRRHYDLLKILGVFNKQQIKISSPNEQRCSIILVQHIFIPICNALRILSDSGFLKFLEDDFLHINKILLEISNAICENPFSVIEISYQ